jgi:hypothetical protein
VSRVVTAVVDGPATGLDGQRQRLADALVGWLETGQRPDDLFTTDVLADLTVPHWRVQAIGDDATFALREDSHPHPGQVTVGLLERTASGFLIAFEERWEDAGQRWYCREMIHCTVDADRVSELTIHCGGDWDEARQRRHAEEVRLVRP